MSDAWRFATTAWSRPEIEALSLELQDVHGQHPGLLLWRLWTMAEGRAVSAGTLAAAVRAARVWEDEVVWPLRAVRRRLRTPTAPFSDSDASSLRERLLSAELAAEQILLETLESLADDRADRFLEPLPDTLTALTAVARAWREPVPVSLLAQLTEAMRQGEP